MWWRRFFFVCGIEKPQKLEASSEPAWDTNFSEYTAHFYSIGFFARYHSVFVSKKNLLIIQEVFYLKLIYGKWRFVLQLIRSLFHFGDFNHVGGQMQVNRRAARVHNNVSRF